MFPTFPVRRHGHAKREERKRKPSEELVKKSHKNAQQSRSSSKSRVHTHHHHHYLYLVTDPLVKPPKQTKMSAIPVNANLLGNGISSFLKRIETKSIVHSTENLQMSKPPIKSGPIDQHFSSPLRKFRNEGAQGNPFALIRSSPRAMEALMPKDTSKLDFEQAISSQFDAARFKFDLEPANQEKLPPLTSSFAPSLAPSLVASNYTVDEDPDFNSHFLEELWDSVSNIREKYLLDILPHSLDLNERSSFDRINSHP